MRRDQLHLNRVLRRHRRRPQSPLLGALKLNSSRPRAFPGRFVPRALRLPVKQAVPCHGHMLERRNQLRPEPVKECPVNGLGALRNPLAVAGLPYHDMVYHMRRELFVIVIIVVLRVWVRYWPADINVGCTTLKAEIAREVQSWEVGNLGERPRYSCLDRLVRLNRIFEAVTGCLFGIVCCLVRTHTPEPTTTLRCKPNLAGRLAL